MQQKAELKVEPKPEPKAEAKVEPRAEVKPAPRVEPRGEAKAAPRVEPKAAPKPSSNGVHKPAGFRKPSDRVEESYFDSLAASVQEHLQRDVRSIVITSAGSGEGKSTVTAGLGRALARSGRQSVCIVDTDRFRPTVHRLFGLENNRGLGELLKELYHLDIGRETPGQFGVGDWLEILHAQSKSGELLVTDGDQ